MQKVCFPTLLPLMLHFLISNSELFLTKAIGNNSCTSMYHKDFKLECSNFGAGENTVGYPHWMETEGGQRGGGSECQSQGCRTRQRPKAPGLLRLPQMSPSP